MIRERISKLIAATESQRPTFLDRPTWIYLNELPHALRRVDNQFYYLNTSDSFFHLKRCQNEISIALAKLNAQLTKEHYAVRINAIVGSSNNIHEPYEFAIGKLFQSIMPRPQKGTSHTWEHMDQAREGLLAIVALLVAYQQVISKIDERLPRLHTKGLVAATETWYEASLHEVDPDSILRTTAQDFGPVDSPNRRNLRGLRIAAEIMTWICKPEPELLFDPTANIVASQK